MEQGIRKREREQETDIPALYFILDSNLVLNLNISGSFSKTTSELSSFWMDGWMEEWIEYASESHIPECCVIIYNICVCNIAAYISSRFCSKIVVGLHY